jgi:hypothetical protein
VGNEEVVILKGRSHTNWVVPLGPNVEWILNATESFWPLPALRWRGERNPVSNGQGWLSPECIMAHEIVPSRVDGNAMKPGDKQVGLGPRARRRTPVARGLGGTGGRRGDLQSFKFLRSSHPVDLSRCRRCLWKSMRDTWNMARSSSRQAIRDRIGQRDASPRSSSWSISTHAAKIDEIKAGGGRDVGHSFKK